VGKLIRARSNAGKWDCATANFWHGTRWDFGMNARSFRALFFARGIFTAAVLVAAQLAQAASEDARITRVIRDVKLLPSEAKPKPAALNDKVSEDTGVSTGDESRSELTFDDLTITRLGANTVFSFNKAGRNVDLAGGSMLLRVPKDSGGATMTTNAITVGITGTTVILEARHSGRNKLIALEGGARVSLKKNPSESVFVPGGMMEDIPPGATKLPAPVRADIGKIMNENPLVTDFAPLPSRDLIYATQGNPPIYPGRPHPVFIRPPILGGTVATGGGGKKPPPRPKRPGKGTGSTSTGTTAAGSPHTGVSGAGLGSTPKPKVSPTPSKRRKPTPNPGPT
jgi:hypothetical protein